MFKPGDIVGRKSYKSDVLFQVKEIFTNARGEKMALLKGLELRLLADAPLEDLEPKAPLEVFRYKQALLGKRVKSLAHFQRWHQKRASAPPNPALFPFPGRVLHLDGDKEYLQKSLEVYRELEVPVKGFWVPEEEQPARVEKLVALYCPDILVITGHDSLLKSRDPQKIESYRNSRFFAAAVHRARQADCAREKLIIFAGACQSFYEALLEAGASFASSPARTFIHLSDPVVIAGRIAYTPFLEPLPLKELIGATISGEKGIGGLETTGCFRFGFPPASPSSKDPEVPPER